MKRLLGRLFVGALVSVGLLLDIQVVLTGSVAAPKDSMLFQAFTDPVAFFSSALALIEGLPTTFTQPTLFLPGAPLPLLLVFRFVLPLAFGAAVAVLTITGAAKVLLKGQDVVLEPMPLEGLVYPRAKTSFELRDEFLEETRHV